MNKYIIFLLLLFLSVSQTFGSTDILKEILERKSDKFDSQLNAADGTSAFKEFVQEIIKALNEQGAKDKATTILKIFSEGKIENGNVADAASIVDSFTRTYYGDEIIESTRTLIKFKTYATDVPNRMNPEFAKQKQFLEKLANKLGLSFRDVGGYVQEIWIGEGPASFGLMVHSDVQPVDEKNWTVDPWAGEIKDGKLWGRGTLDDKGPLTVIMYGMRALLDSGLKLNKKLILLVGTDEESANEDVATYLKTNKAPDQTIIVDSNFPVICAEKGWCGTWLKLARTGMPSTNQKGFLIEDLQAGFSPSIVPGKATVRLAAKGMGFEEAESFLHSEVQKFTAQNPDSKFELKTEDAQFFIEAYGRQVHSAAPATGHNALMDLVVFLDRNIKPLQNSLSLMAKFAATYIGLEIDGEKLGIKHEDDFMGTVTVAANMFQTTQDTVLFMFNYRLPKGIALSKVEKTVKARFRNFATLNKIEFVERHYFSEPLYNDPESPFVQKLLSIFNDATGGNYKAESIGGGTYAKRIPNSVVFGPALPGHEYMGHQPDEFISLETLERNIEVLTNTLVQFGVE